MLRMLRTRFYIILSVLMSVLPLSGASQPVSPYDAVNPFIGTGNEGNCYPGAQAPFGMISISPNNPFDKKEDVASRPGYKYSRSEINGFGMTHFSGVGCHAMQDLQFLPVTGSLDRTPVGDRFAYRSEFSHEHETAKPGYYAVSLPDYQVDTKFTAMPHSAIGEFAFKSADDAHCVFMPTNSANGIGAGELHIETSSMTVTGWVSTGGFCWRDPHDRPYRVYFVAKFNARFSDYGTWKGREKFPRQSNVAGDDIAAFVSFGNRKDRPVKMKMAISYVSIDNARQNLNAEISCWDFDGVHRTVQDEWTDYLSRMTVEGGTEAERKTFYTAVYHNLLHPNIYNDVNGAYMGFDDKVHQVEPGRKQYANFSLWDTYRTSSFLQALLAPKESSDMIQSLLHDAEQGGAYPNWSMNNVEYGVMNGYSTFPFIAAMYAMGARDFDLQASKDMMKKVSTSYLKCKGYQGWVCLDDYMRYGYVPVDRHGHGASMTLEYCIDDFSIAQICKAAGDSSAYSYYMDRAQNFENIFDKETRLFRPRKQDGSFLSPFTETGTDGYNEGNAIQYFWSVPHNMDAVISLAGGRKFVEDRLDAFTSKINRGWAPDQPYYWLGNEPCFGSAFVYNYLGKPWKSQILVRKVLSSFNDTPDGLPGDDDAGAMSALYVFSAIGLYPCIPGIGGFTVTGPLFDRVQIKTGKGKVLVITAQNAPTVNPYIQSVRFNKKDVTSTWIPWHQLEKGGVLDFVMGNMPDRHWGTGSNAAPPSFY